MRKPLYWSTQVQFFPIFQQDQLILSNISLIKTKKWKNIAQILKNNNFNKKQAECRQRYINFLSLSIDKASKISLEDLELFYKKYQEFGPRWTQIQQFLPNKSQVELKNIFYGNIRCLIKKVFKFFTSKTAVFVNKFDTFTLQNIYSAKKNYKGLGFVKEDIKNMNFRFDETLCLSLIQEKKEKYKNLFKVLLEEDLTKKSKHIDWFKKVQEKYIECEPNLAKSSQMFQFERKSTDLNPNPVAIIQQEKQDQYPFLQRSTKYETNYFGMINGNWRECQIQYPNPNIAQYQQLHNPQIIYNQQHQICLQNYQSQVFNPFQNYQNPYFYCPNWN